MRNKKTVLFLFVVITIAITTYHLNIDNSHLPGERTKMRMVLFFDLLDKYKSKYGDYPAFLIDLKKLERDKKKYPNLKLYEIDLVDEWVEKFVYKKEERNYQLYSKGANKIDEGMKGDDIYEASEDCCN